MERDTSELSAGGNSADTLPFQEDLHLHVTAPLASYITSPPEAGDMHHRKLCRLFFIENPAAQLFGGRLFGRLSAGRRTSRHRSRPVTHRRRSGVVSRPETVSSTADIP